MLRIIFVNEYLRRVRTKAFLLTTLLMPAGVVAVAAVVGGLVAHSVQSESKQARQQGIAVYDEDGRLFPMLQRNAMRQQGEDDESAYLLTAVAGPLAAAKARFRAGGYHGLLHLPAGLADEVPPPIKFFVKEKQSVIAEDAMRDFVLRAVRELRLARHGLSPEAYATMRQRLIFNVVGLAEDGDEKSGSVGASGIAATVVAMIILMVGAIYGGTVMQAIMEEKSSRMAEVVISSAAPFELLLGKILAVSAMAATQMGVWLILLAAGGLAVAGFAFGDVPTPEGGEGSLLDDEFVAEAFPGGLPQVRWDVVAVVLVMLPLGYLINASVFAALGAMHENPWEAQMSVTLAMLPMVISIIVAQTIVFAPNSPLVLVCAYLPFTAPAILPARMLLVDMALWQVAFSVVLCAAATLGMIWLCGRIFRGSLLIYGKKFGWRELRQVIAAD